MKLVGVENSTFQSLGISMCSTNLATSSASGFELAAKIRLSNKSNFPPVVVVGLYSLLLCFINFNFYLHFYFQTIISHIVFKIFLFQHRKSILFIHPIHSFLSHPTHHPTPQITPPTISGQDNTTSLGDDKTSSTEIPDMGAYLTVHISPS